MARVTVTIEGDTEEIRTALRTLLGELALESGSQGVLSKPAVTPEQTGSTNWTPDELARFWPFLTKPAQRILRLVAEKPEGYPSQDLERVLGYDMRHIGGNLSSVGHAMRRLYRVGDSYTKPWPIERDGATGQYRMQPDVAAVIRRLADNEGEGKQ
jgi:hypothetical protein